MATALPDFERTASALRELARRGDWFGARECADRLADMQPVANHELVACLRTLEETLLAAKTSRAFMTATLRRVRAAAKFENGRVLPR